MDTSISSRGYWPTGLALSLSALLLLGCRGVIQGVSPVQPIPARTAPVSVAVSGSGTCGEMEIDWGDTQKITPQSVDLGGNPVFDHHYGLGGGKTVTVEGKRGCLGKVRTRFIVQPAAYALAFIQVQKPGEPSAPTCVGVPNHPGVRLGEQLRITTTPAGGWTGINFGCPFNGCIYDADGRPGSVADSSFPFPGLREYSLVLRVDETFGVREQVVQGGTNVSFTSTVDGQLKVCLNDHDMTNNSGGYQIDIRLDQLGPP